MIEVLLRELMSCFLFTCRHLRIEVCLILMIMSHPCANGEKESNAHSYPFTDGPLPSAERMDHTIMTLDHLAFPSLDDHVS